MLFKEKNPVVIDMKDKNAVSGRIEHWIAKGFTDVEACKKVGITTRAYLKMRAENEEIEKRYKLALEDQIQFYEKEARRRAVHGYTEVTRDGNGKVLKRVHKYDSDLLTKMLAARDKRYRTAQKGTIGDITFNFGDKLEAARARVKKMKAAIIVEDSNEPK
jgi:hypothetical protein